MREESARAAAAGDRRVHRTRAALFAAAVRLVSEHGTTSISVTELADAAGVSRQVVYLHFGDRESLFAAAAMDLAERELYPLFAELDQGSLRMRILSAAQHLSRYHRFFRALVTGPCAFAVRAAAVRSFEALHGRATVPVFDETGPPDAAVTATFLVGGAMAVIDDWLLADAHEPDPQILTDRLLAVIAYLGHRPPATFGSGLESDIR
ncbi:TetR/AcrR family transcriptional regulator [Nocardia sp. BMG51109]|uniref:TetR/AcrR family transcriptional regulator n=1 Tax=Nocardia sp. BMG51109 TaxID=1056816 RepID=UPI0004640C7F|nr:TetR family transcriptional regulator [Nocardia sp. BMG51109]